VHRSLHFRLVAVVVALLGSLSASAFALTHGLVHAHLAHEHEHEQGELGEPLHDASMLAFEEHSSDDHAHGHPSLDAVISARHLGRLDLPNVDVAILTAPIVALQAAIIVRAPLPDHALLARPDPGGGPPPTLRAPPIS